jgi:hypothetical protein
LAPDADFNARKPSTNASLSAKMACFQAYSQASGDKTKACLIVVKFITDPNFRNDT